MRLPDHATRHAALLIAVLLAALALWVICLLLLMAITTQLLDTLRFIVELGGMS